MLKSRFFPFRRKASERLSEDSAKAVLVAGKLKAIFE